MAKKEKINEIIKEAEKDSKKEKEKSKIVKDFLIIDYDSNYLALQLEYLREVFDLNNIKDIVSIPFTPDYILGIINVREEIIPVISLHKILGLDEKSHDFKKIAILDVKFKIAIPYMDILDLKIMDIDKIKLIKNASKKEKDQLITQEFEFNDKIIGVIDILKIYSSEYLQ